MDIKIPFLGDGIESANVIGILVSEGDTVEVDQTLVELETDKATAPVPATASGKVSKIFLKEGDVVSQGKLVLTLDSGGAEVPASTESEAAPSAPAPVQVQAPVPTQAPIQATPGSYTYVSQTGNAPPAAPSIRKMAAQTGLDLSRIMGSGNGGRITWEDVRSHVTMLQSIAFSPSSPQGIAAAEPTKPPKKKVDFSKWGPVRIEKASSLRQKISEHLHDAWTTIPHVTQFDDADITDLMALRKKYNPQYKKKNTNLTMTVFALKAAVAALKEFPLMNASFDEDTGEITYKDYYHIGIAVDTENGLIVPVIRDVDQKSLMTLSLELSEIAEKARDRKLGVEALQGATFTISNLGSLGVAGFTPIVNHPEVAIIGLGTGKVLPRYLENEIQARMIMPVSLSYDHRVVDGADGARFVRKFITEIETFEEGLLKEKKV